MSINNGVTTGGLFSKEENLSWSFFYLSFSTIFTIYKCENYSVLKICFSFCLPITNINFSQLPSVNFPDCLRKLNQTLSKNLIRMIEIILLFFQSFQDLWRTWDFCALRCYTKKEETSSESQTFCYFYLKLFRTHCTKYSIYSLLYRTSKTLLKNLWLAMTFLEKITYIKRVFAIIMTIFHNTILKKRT